MNHNLVDFKAKDSKFNYERILQNDTFSNNCAIYLLTII